MAQIIGSVLGITTLVLFFRWDRRKKFQLFHFIIELFVAGIIFYIGNIVGDFLSKNIHISVPFYNRIPNVLKIG